MRLLERLARLVAVLGLPEGTQSIVLPAFAQGLPVPATALFVR